MTTHDLFWALALPVIFMSALIVGAVFVEHLAPKARKSWARLDRHRRGREAQAKLAAEARAIHDEERQRAAKWISEHCFWHQEPRQ